MPAADALDQLEALSTVMEMLTRRWLPDGRYAALRPQMFNVRLILTGADDMYSEDGWCYRDLRSAAAALKRWDPEIEDEPSGWMRHPTSGRRRVNVLCATCGDVIGQLEWTRW